MRGKNKTLSVSLTFTTAFSFVLYADSQIFKLSQSNFSDHICVCVYIYISPKFPLSNSHFLADHQYQFCCPPGSQLIISLLKELIFLVQDFFCTVHWTFLLLLPNFDYSLISTSVFILIHLISYFNSETLPINFCFFLKLKHS